MRLVVPGIQIERDLLRRLAAQRRVERLNEQRHEQFAQPVEIGDADRILKPRQRGLTGQVLLGIAGVSADDELEDRIAAERVVPRVRGIDSRVPTQRPGELLGVPQPLVHLPKDQQPRVAGQRRPRHLDLNRTIPKFECKFRDTLSTHRGLRA